MKIKRPAILSSFPSPGLCESCGVPCSSRERHHIFSRGAGGPDLPINIIMLGDAFTGHCACHIKFHGNGLKRFRLQFLDVVAKREQTTVEAIVDVICLVRRLPKDATEETVRAAIELLENPLSRRLARDQLTLAKVLT